MKSLNTLTTLLSLLPSTFSIHIPPWEWVDYYSVPVDHFSTQPKSKQHFFNLKVLGYSKYAKPDGPIFFYSGNEGSIEGFWNNTGLPFDWAAEFGADVVMTEHRYYGSSLPFGDDSFSSKENRQYLRIEQTLNDYAMFMKDYQVKKGTAKKVMVFGGSYGGMLAAFLRQRYPNIFHGAIAASAPIPQAFNLMGNGRQNIDFYKVVTDDARAANPHCPSRVQQAFTTLNQIFERNDPSELSTRVQKPFKLCKTPTKSEWDYFMQYARNAWTTLAMCDYPYASSFLAPLPKWPIRAACRKVMHSGDDSEDLDEDSDSDSDTDSSNYPISVTDDKAIHGLAAAVNLPYAKPGSDECLDMYKLFIACADQTGCGTGNDATAWDFQMCNDFSIMVTSTNTTDMFPQREWSTSMLNDYCMKTYQVEPSPYETGMRLGAVDAEYPKFNSDSYNNIVFSNGLLDPWHAGGYLNSLNKDTMPAVKIRLGAHHLDLRGSDPRNDPRSVVIARKIEKAYTHKWMNSGRWRNMIEKMGGTEGAEIVFKRKMNELFEELEKVNEEEEEMERESRGKLGLVSRLVVESESEKELDLTTSSKRSLKSLKGLGKQSNDDGSITNRLGKGESNSEKNLEVWI